ncbi:hypothetical protein EVAR_44694_1 [Eumeta japonica]|uniref:Uncharacterized protein n=1 Tax=Eumeta variegata TaxID=151549 RepID=A0A4C1XKM9_EUMVA|nr:hypothetical protein EVAR_44694_1 [Eumeta japonica]
MNETNDIQYNGRARPQNRSYVIVNSALNELTSASVSSLGNTHAAIDLRHEEAASYWLLGYVTKNPIAMSKLKNWHNKSSLSYLYNSLKTFFDRKAHSNAPHRESCNERSRTVQTLGPPSTRPASGVGRRRNVNSECLSAGAT